MTSDKVVVEMKTFIVRHNGKDKRFEVAWLKKEAGSSVSENKKVEYQKELDLKDERTLDQLIQEYSVLGFVSFTPFFADLSDEDKAGLARIRRQKDQGLYEKKGGAL